MCDMLSKEGHHHHHHCCCYIILNFVFILVRETEEMQNAFSPLKKSPSYLEKNTHPWVMDHQHQKLTTGPGLSVGWTVSVEGFCRGCPSWVGKPRKTSVETLLGRNVSWRAEVSYSHTSLSAVLVNLGCYHKYH